LVEDKGPCLRKSAIGEKKARNRLALERDGQ
jgi:hypothetical protein